MGVVTVLLAAYWTVLLAELAGDKSIYTVTSLALRFRPASVFCGLTAAFMGKMLAAVLLGRTLLYLPSKWLTAASAGVFFATALSLWFRGSGREPSRTLGRSWSNAVAVSFGAIFFSEWGDLGQVSAAALTARYQLPVAIWLGATLAMMTKASLALTAGLQLRRRISERLLRLLATLSCAALGTASLIALAAR